MGAPGGSQVTAVGSSGSSPEYPADGGNINTPGAILPFFDARREWSRQYCWYVLNVCDGSVRRAARLLGMQRHSLRRILFDHAR